MAAVSVLRASVGTAVNGGCEMAISAVVPMAAAVCAGADGITGDAVDAVEGTAAAAEAPAPDIDTRLFELDVLRRGSEWEVDGRGLNARRRTGGAVLRAWD